MWDLSFPIRESNLRPLHCQADSSPPDQHGSPEDQAFLINALAFTIRDEAASHASVTHLLWLKERASKMCSSALVRTGVNQETECVYVKWLTFNVCRIRGKKSSLILV